MSAFPDWEQYTVHQRHSLTGCIPTGYETLLRAAGVGGIDFGTFQEEFELDLQRPQGTEPQNNFGSVGNKVSEKYPHVVFAQKSFQLGAEKMAFIEGRLAKRKPVLISLAMLNPWGQLLGWHIMPVVDDDTDRICLLKYVHADGWCLNAVERLAS